MIVNIMPQYPCHSSMRIMRGLRDTAPSFASVAYSDREADLTLIYVGGRINHVKRHIEQLKEAGKKYAILQLVLRYGRTRNTWDWLPVWEGAELVWSYYDLATEMAADFIHNAKVHFYHSALGVDFDTFKVVPAEKKYLVVGEGADPKRENLYNLAEASKDHRMLHLGPNLNLGGHVDSFRHLSDEELVLKYNECRFASGLRSVEGFEYTAAEGILCGARPILFDRRHHRKWFGDLAEYIPEDAYVVRNLKKVMSKERPVTGEDLAEARYRFSWPVIGSGFWRALVEGS